MLAEAGYDLDDPVAREGDEREVVAEYLAAHELTQASIAAPEDISPGDVAAASQRLPCGLRVSRGESLRGRTRTSRPRAKSQSKFPCMEAPPYSAAAVDVVRLPAGRQRARPRRGRGAARDPHRRPAGRGDDAHARATTRSSRSASASRRASSRRRATAGRPRREHRRRRRAGLRSCAAPAELLHDVVVRRLRQGRARGGRGRGAARRVEAAGLACARVVAARPAARGAGGVRRDGRPARDRPLHRGRRARSARARTSAGTTRSTR